MLKKRLKKLFIPHEGNNFKPDVLERTSMGIMLVLIMLSFTIANLQSLIWISSEWLVSSILPAVIVENTNNERNSEQLNILRRNTLLDTAAQMKAEDMSKNSYFAHYSPEGISPWYWFDEVGYSFVYAGENLAIHFADSNEVVNAWMESPTHRANILDGNYTEIGVGTAKGVYGGIPTVFVVQLFATPKAREESREILSGSEIDLEKAVLVSTQDVVHDSSQNTNVLAKQFMTATDTAMKSEEGKKLGSVITQLAELENVVVKDQTQLKDMEEIMAEKKVSGETMVKYSDFASTSRPGIPAILESMDNNLTSGTTYAVGTIERTAIQPSIWLQFIYGILAFLVSGALIISIIIERRRQNPVQIAYAGGLLATMAFLFYIHTVLTSTVFIT